MRVIRLRIADCGLRTGVRAARSRRFPSRGPQSPFPNPQSLRSGTASLELVLSLPLMLLIMALIINFGTFSSWKARSNVAARYAVWRTLTPRTGGNNPNPPNWFTPATMGALPGIQLSTVNQSWNQQDLAHPALRGPAITDPQTGSTLLLDDRRYLEMVDSMSIGFASLQRSWPFGVYIPKAPRMKKNPQAFVLDHFWRFGDMGFGYNDSWRIKNWYRIEAARQGNGQLMNLFMMYQNADQSILTNPDASTLRTLDRDQDFIDFGRNPADACLYVVNQARLPGCEADPKAVMFNYIVNRDGMIRWIQGPTGKGGQQAAPWWLAQQFINLYKQVEIPYYEAQTPPDQVMIDHLKELIQQLQQFQGMLN